MSHLKIKQIIKTSFLTLAISGSITSNNAYSNDKKGQLFLICEGIEESTALDEKNLPFRKEKNIKFNLRIKSRAEDYFKKNELYSKKIGKEQLENDKNQRFYSIYFNNSGIINGKELYTDFRNVAFENGFEKISTSFFVTELNINLLIKINSFMKINGKLDGHEVNYDFHIDRITGEFIARKDLDFIFSSHEKNTKSSGICKKTEKRI